MSIVISSEDGKRLPMNAWNWGVLHHLVEQAGIFPEDVWEPARYIGTDLDRAQVCALIDFLEGRVLPGLAPNERLFPDGTKAGLPDDGTFFREPSEQWKNYSLQRAVLVDLLDLLKTSSGPVSFY
jgi:hypothetical protein